MKVSATQTKTRYSFSVTELAEFACRKGDLESVGFGGATSEEGQVGHQIHQSRQKKRYSHYQPEYSVKYQGVIEDIGFAISSRIDGVCLDLSNEDAEIWLEEIKTSYLPASDLPQAKTSVHYGQLKIYAYLLLASLKEQNEEKIVESIVGYQTWYRLPKGDVEQQQHTWKYNELKAFFYKQVSKYISWLLKIEGHRKNIRRSCKKLSFPFSNYRENQHRLCQEVYRQIRNKHDMVFEAPTGIGKSISVLFPSIKAIGEGLVEQIQFLTAKRSGQRTANETLSLIQQHGSNLESADINSTKLRSVTLTSRQQQCFCQNNQQEDCEYTKNYYDKLAEVRDYCLDTDLSAESDWLTTVAKKFTICPYSLAREMSKWLDVVIMDYNYMFDPIIRLERFESDSNRRVALIDESHNLIDRARSMYSVTLSEYDAYVLLDSKSLSKKEKNFLTKQVNRISETLLAIEQQQTRAIKNNEWTSVELSAKTIEKLLKTLETIFSDCLTALREEVIEDIDIEWLGGLYRFMQIVESRDEHGYFFIRKVERGLLTAIELQMVNVNPASKLKDIYSKNRANILFSGTLRPESYIRSSLGIRKDIPYFQLPQVFKSEQMAVCIDADIDMRYQYRDRSIDKIIETIFTCYQSRQGNYLVAFSSYAFMQKVHRAFIDQYANITTAIQQREFSSDDRQAFIDGFFNSQRQIGFVLMGGVFAEGVDFKGESLIGVIVVGQGLPQPDEIRNKIKDDFTKEGENGYLLAYQYPGLQRVLQTSGRLIRTESDQGSIVLLDKRFCRADVSSTLPQNWLIKRYKRTDELAQHLDSFWRNKG